MKKFKIFIVDDDRTDGGTMHVDNGVVISNAARLAQKNNPDGWQDMSIGWERNMTLYGVVRNFSLALGFVRETAKILRKIFYIENIERKLSLLITMLNLTLTNTSFAFNYLFLYKGDLDLSTFQDEANKVTMNIMEGGISRLLKANEGTMYPIPLNDPEAISVYSDGIELFQSVHYGVTDGLHYAGPNKNYAIDIVETSREGRSAEVVNTSQVFDPVPGTIISGLDDYRHNSTNYFIQNTGTTTVFTRLTGKVYFKCNIISWGISTPAIDKVVKLKLVSNDDGAVGGNYTLTDPQIGETYEIDLSLTALLDGILDQRYFFVVTFGLTESGGVGSFDFEFMPDSKVTSEFVSLFAATRVKMFPLWIYYRKLVGKVTGNEADAVSALLALYPNICITCGDAIRGFDTAKIVSKMTDLFIAANVQFNAGMGIELNKLTLEEKAHYFDYSDPIPLGEVKSLKVTRAKDLTFNTLKIGSESKDYEDINGRDEFNTTYLFGSPITRDVKEYNLVSPYRRDSYGYEYTRINFDGKLTTDSNSDNDIWLVNVDKDVEHNELLMPYLTDFESVAPNLFKFPVPFLVVGTKIIISGPYNVGLFTVVNVSYLVVGFTYVTVLEAVTTQNGGTMNTGAVYTNVVEPYVLKRGTYDTITGLLSPSSVFNLEDMTIQRLIEKHGNWIRSMMWGFDNEVMPFLATDKNGKLFTSKNGKVYDEDADIIIKDLAAPLCIPVYFEVETKVPVNLPSLLENNPAKCFSFIWDGNLYKGFLMKAGISIADNGQQVFKLLSTPDNDLSKLVV